MFAVQRFASRDEAQAYMVCLHCLIQHTYLFFQNEQASKPQSEEAAKCDFLAFELEQQYFKYLGEELAKSRNTWDDSSSGVTVEPNENKTTTGF